ncbi:hypothetical protein HAL013_06280 [Helicobacter ailurogastricus]|uniref:Uncharacterized protein n=1 Tax=Helicobacter ailurogastricus TaxID=1578720 RepID=A0A0K2X7G6_9HELI|nr:hypothetical protein HAL011_15290 [Helicobacter ailurogastricus]CRF42447.1 hypothetical protein HAL013_06280 [Helicobacter ailurogastricus]
MIYRFYCGTKRVVLQRFVEIEHADTEKKNRQTSRNLIFKTLKEGWDRG